MADERRGDERLVAWFPLRIDAEELGRSVGIAKNVSTKGMLVASTRKFVVGAPVSLSLHVRPGEEEPREITGTIVRLLPNEEDPDGVWSYKMAVEFDDPNPDLVRSILSGDG